MACVRAYFAELAERFEGGFDPAAVGPLTSDVVLVARSLGEPVACGAVLLHPGYAEIKRVWVARAARGAGLGRRMMLALEAWSRGAGAALVRLDTNRALPEAMAMYRALGYREIARFGDNPYAHHFFEKQLT